MTATARKAALPPPLPTPKPRARAGVCDVPQEAFAEPAVALAAKLGWEGPPGAVVFPPRNSGETDAAYALRVRFEGITVRDAQRFLQKTLHEHYAAGALGEKQPDSSEARAHLAVDTPEESEAVDAALAAAYESGKGQPTSEVEIKKASMDVGMKGSAGAMLGNLARGEAKAAK